jgi:hypothetical protein
MPVFAYRCDCGRTVDVLVRGGREPATCDDVPELAGCATAGTLTKQLSAPYVGSSGGTGASEAPATCGHCGNAPGSCMN